MPNQLLIIKLNATGDVVRTTTLLRCFSSDVTWITAAPNAELLPEQTPTFRRFEWAQRDLVRDRQYDLVINLEDEAATAAFATEVPHTRLFGATLDEYGSVTYTEDSREWFDLSLISVHGRARADQLKLSNRRTYQELVFEGLGQMFAGEPYVLPASASPTLSGDVAIAPNAGPVWPMKGWAYYDLLKGELEAIGLSVNVLPKRQSLLEHLADLRNHRCLVSGDSLPMHLALGTGTPCVTLFNCTSPWEIYDYGLQTKLVSPLLEQFFYKRGYDVAATTAIRLDDVFNAVMTALRVPAHSLRSGS
jgi:ADP-heptose:LPS heptosyltransferase